MLRVLTSDLTFYVKGIVIAAIDKRVKQIDGNSQFLKSQDVLMMWKCPEVIRFLTPRKKNMRVMNVTSNHSDELIN